MKQSLFKIFLVIFCVLFLNDIYAQGGGPPMLTDDPATVDAGKWEINTSINSQLTKEETQLSVPYIDANYGISKRAHIKIEFPYLITIDEQKHAIGEFENPLIGIKFHFIDESKNFVSVSTYPQATVTGSQKNFLLPLLMAKTIGRFVIGEEIGYLIVEKNSNNLLNGNLVSYKVSDKLEVIAEYFIQKGFSMPVATQGFMNYGCRYEINKTFTFLGSLGTQVVTPANEQRQYFFSFIGLQSDF
jgi:hypothetical protein